MFLSYKIVSVYFFYFLLLILNPIFLHLGRLNDDLELELSDDGNRRPAAP